MVAGRPSFVVSCRNVTNAINAIFTANLIVPYNDVPFGSMHTGGMNAAFGDGSRPVPPPVASTCRPTAPSPAGTAAKSSPRTSNPGGPMIRSFTLAASALAGAALLVGCGSGEQLHDVSGTITFEGKPIPKGLIFFDPDARARRARRGSPTSRTASSTRPFRARARGSAAGRTSSASAGSTARWPGGPVRPVAVPRARVQKELAGPEADVRLRREEGEVKPAARSAARPVSLIHGPVTGVRRALCARVVAGLRDAHKCIVSVFGVTQLALLALLAPLEKSPRKTHISKRASWHPWNPSWPPSDAHFWPILATWKLAPPNSIGHQQPDRASDPVLASGG